MFWRLFFALTTILLTMNAVADAAMVSIALKDTNGQPAANAVVTLSPVGSVVPSHVAGEVVIDQRHQMFMPFVVAVRRGGRVVFANNDDTMHQVYSFSAVKQFEAEIEKGHRSAPIVFEKSGVAVIGCNIHDNMIAYVFVTDALMAAVTDVKGTAVLDVPPGTYRASLWHPRLLPGDSAAAMLAVTESGTTFSRVLPLAADRTASMHERHKQSY